MWDVFMLFMIPIGGGIPGGVVLAHSRGIPWPTMMLLYLLSDVVLACIFEPILLLVIAYSKKKAFVARLREAFRRSFQMTTARYGTQLGPLALILVSFGVDPMTGRTVAIAAGHGFVTGWMIAIAGDLLYFTLIMACTLWLSSVLGDGTWATFIIIALMILVPSAIRRVRARFSKK